MTTTLELVKQSEVLEQSRTSIIAVSDFILFQRFILILPLILVEEIAEIIQGTAGMSGLGVYS